MKAKYVNKKVIDPIATGEIARKARHKVGLSLRKVARKMKVSEPFLSDLERGRRNWLERHLTLFWDALESCGNTKSKQ